MPNASGSSSSRRSGPGRSGSKPGGSRGHKRGGPKGGSARGRSNDGDNRNSDRRDSSDGRRDSRDSRGSGSRGKDSRGGPRGNSSSRGGRDGYQGRKRDDRPKKPARAESSGWGSVAQHGAAGATIGQRMFEQEAEERFSPEERRKFAERQARRDKVAARNEGLREQARQAIDRGGLPPLDPNTGDRVTIERRPLPGRPPKPADVEREMERLRGKEKASRGWRLFKRAAKEFQNEQFTDARKTMKPLTESYPNIAELHELHGLALYRLGHWEDAIGELEMFRQMSGTAEQNPVLMDCHRALGNWADVDELWAELGELSPSGELVTEGRIVMAGSQADRGFLDGGVRTLEKGWKIPSEPMDHHLRRAYALADLLERDGKIPKSRKLFGWIASKDPYFGDAAERAN